MSDAPAVTDRMELLAASLAVRDELAAAVEAERVLLEIALDAGELGIDSDEHLEAYERIGELESALVEATIEAVDALDELRADSILELAALDPDGWEAAAGACLSALRAGPLGQDEDLPLRARIAAAIALFEELDDERALTIRQELADGPPPPSWLTSLALPDRPPPGAPKSEPVVEPEAGAAVPETPPEKADAYQLGALSLAAPEPRSSRMGFLSRLPARPSPLELALAAGIAAAVIAAALAADTFM